MFGVPIDGSAQVFCDNESVVKNSTNVESKLKKKHIDIAYHKVRESVAAGTITIYYEPSQDNLVDLLTKSVSRERRRYLLGGIFC